MVFRGGWGKENEIKVVKNGTNLADTEIKVR